jgi:hypothetical protein
MLRALSLSIIACLISCTNDKSVVVPSTTNAFYYWQTSLRNFNWQDSVYHALEVKKIYLRFFDVDWSVEGNAPVPISPLDLYSWSNIDSHAETIPVVFITNETFKSLSLEQSVQLAGQVHRKLMAFLSVYLARYSSYDLYDGKGGWQQNPYNIKSAKFDEHRRYDSLYHAQMNNVKEIQFDCDWTPSTKDKYFAFLQEVKKLFNDKLISSTIRLYQYKYPKEAGVPPVERGMLMCYNAGSVKDPKTRNSIFDKKEIMSYLESANYPLPLDYALPVFGWALLYHDDQLKDILPSSSLQEYKHYLTLKDDHAYVNADFVFGHTAKSILVRKDDMIRFERPDMDDVNEVAAWLAEHKNNKEAVLTLYHLNDYDLQTYSEEIESIFNSF